MSIRTSPKQSKRLSEAGVRVRSESEELAWHEFEGVEYQSWVARPTLGELLETTEAKRLDISVMEEFLVRWTHTPQGAADMNKQRFAEFSTFQGVLDFIADLISEEAEKRT